MEVGIHDARGYWIAEAGEPEPLQQLRTDIEADVVVVGGGFTGMWTAWHLTSAEPGARVVLLESDRFGFGPSGRNGGFCDAMWVSFASLVERFGAEAATEVGRVADDSIAQIGDFAEEQGIDCWFNRSGYLNVSTAPAQDGSWDANVEAMEAAGFRDLPPELDREGVAAICRSPAFREGLLYRQAATVQPARLAFGLRDALLEAGASLFEKSAVIGFEEGRGGVVAHTELGSVRADRAVLAGGAAMARTGWPFAGRVTMASSHMVISEPVPELIEEIGWTGGEAISDCRALLNYFRTTPDGRIAFGWGGGRIAAGGRRRGTSEVDPSVTRRVIEHAVAYFPGLEGKSFEHAWGGPIDATATHLPHVVRFPPGRVFGAIGYTGNGVGPSQMVGRCLASLARGVEDRYSTLPLVEPIDALTRVPPEPFRWLGGAVIRAAIENRETAEMAGVTPDPISGGISKIPGLIGFHIGR
ncbi:MAG: NAD(P)/FAD-dependent oxidoreductase [Solirubrobacterales bacterium]